MESSNNNSLMEFSDSDILNNIDLRKPDISPDLDFVPRNIVEQNIDEVDLGFNLNNVLGNRSENLEDFSPSSSDNIIQTENIAHNTKQQFLQHQQEIAHQQHLIAQDLLLKQQSQIAKHNNHQNSNRVSNKAHHITQNKKSHMQPPVPTAIKHKQQVRNINHDESGIINTISITIY